MSSRYTLPIIAVVAAVIIAVAGCVVIVNNNDSDDNEIFDRIGIIGAMATEVEILNDAMDTTRVTKISGMEFYEGTLEGQNIVLVQSGIGKVNAGVCAQMLITKFNATSIINTGVAGALDETLDIGDFVISVDAAQHDYDLSPIGYEKGVIPEAGTAFFKANPKLILLAEEAIKKYAPSAYVLKGTVCSGDQFIASDEERARIIEEFGGACCEMEGAAIAQVCHMGKVPFVIIRAMSDKADGTAPEDYSEFEKMVAHLSSQVVRHMLQTI